MKGFPIDLASVDWLYVAELYALVLFSTLIGTLALMFAAVLIFWFYYSGDSTDFGLIGQLQSCSVPVLACVTCAAANSPFEHHAGSGRETRLLPFRRLP